MNAFAVVDGLKVRTANLDDAGERARIDAFVAGQAEAELFHRPHWILAVERGCGQRSHYLLAEDRAGTLQGILPLTEVRSLLFGSALVSAGFAVGGGIVARSQEAADALADHAWRLAVSLGCASAELRGGGEPPRGWIAMEGVYASFARDLPTGEEAILKSIPRKQRAEIRRAGTFDLEVSVGSGAIDRETHYPIYAESVRNLGTPVFPRRLFEAMLDRFDEDADILTIRQDGQPLASVLSF